MQTSEKEQGASRRGDPLASPKAQHHESGQSSRVAGSQEGATTSRMAGSTVPVSPVAGQLSTRAPLNMQFHNENIMAFLEKQRKRLQRLVHPRGPEAALNKAS